MRGDAELAAVWFANSQVGWATGDRGVIWHTHDGGRTWALQESTVSCRLNDVTFINEQIGWAVGGTTQPYAHVCRGVVLRTQDGGEHWSAVNGLLAPTLTRVQFFDLRRGIAVGQASAGFPTGVFATQDGGRNWIPLSNTWAQGWLAGDFVDLQTGAVAGRAGLAASVRQRSLHRARTGRLASRSLRDLVLASPTRGWLVGDGGLVLASSNLGAGWRAVPGPLPRMAARCFDFHAVAAIGHECWIAGTPGSRVFHTADGGRSWAAFPTGNRLPIRDLVMVDRTRGWAVGALGTILATRDGGKTWQRQRGGGTRAAFLDICGRPDLVPLELFAHLSADGGYLGVAQIVGHPAVSTGWRAGSRWHIPAREAIVAVGGCDAHVAWRFPLPAAALAPSADQLVGALDRANDGHGLQQLDAHLVRGIRMWRPAVIFVPGSRPGVDVVLAHLIEQAVLRSVVAAADPAQYVDMTREAGLEPWSVLKVFARVPPSDEPPLRIQTRRLVPRFGRALSQYTTCPRGLLTNHFAPPPSQLAFRPLVDRAPRHGGHSGFFRGIPMATGGPARRTPADPLIEDIGHLKQMVQQYRNIQKMLDMDRDNPAWMGELDHLTRTLDPTSAGEVLFQSGARCLQAGHLDRAAQVFDMLAERRPRHPLVTAVRGWLIRYYASGETAWRAARQVGPGVASGDAPVVTDRSVRQTGPAGATGSRPAAQAAMPAAERPRAPVHGASTTPAERITPTARWTRAVELGKRLERTDPLVYADPGIRFPLAVAQRNLGASKDANRLFLSLGHARPHDAWWACAQGEQWLGRPAGAPPKPVWKCHRTAVKPHLDGHLDEPFWSTAVPITLQNPRRDDSRWPATARAAHDDGFLYLAIECHKAPGCHYPASKGIRPRDPDLSAHDRVDVFIDVDRDYATYDRLTVDHRGWAADACLGDTSWNPTWYVAARDIPETWTVEAAIPWSALVRQAPEPHGVWAVGVQRIVPGTGFQSWTRPADVRVIPEGFGYLVFE